MITLIVYNGLCNRLGPLISSLRLARKSNKKVNMVWSYTPVRSCITYYGDLCKFSELYDPVDDLVIDNDIPNDNFVYEFKYWDNKDHIINENVKDNIYVNYALYTLVSVDDPKDSMFVNLKKSISEPKRIEFDEIGNELSDIMKSLKPRAELQEEINKFNSKFYKNMIGIHIRKSDGGFTKLDWDNIIKKILLQCKEWCTKDKDNGIFLATDDSSVYVDFAIKLGNKLIFYDPPKVLCDTSSSSYGKFNNDKYNVMCAVVELNLLGNCNKFIIGTCDSTFSVCAMLLSNKDTQKYLMNSVDSIPEFI